MSAYMYMPLKKSSNIRLITLCLGQPGDDIVISLCETKFDKNNPPHYEALSYVWGKEKHLEPVYVENGKMKSKIHQRFYELSSLRLARQNKELPVMQDLMVM
jgi:hypothetical protein